MFSKVITNHYFLLLLIAEIITLFNFLNNYRPENASRLFDLIKVNDNNVLPAFYYALNDTLVAKDITSATRISMSSGQRWRTVTLKGEVVEVSGAMTGGGGTQKK